MKAKRIVSAILALVLCLSLSLVMVSCSDTTGSGNSSSSQNSQTGSQEGSSSVEDQSSSSLDEGTSSSSDEGTSSSSDEGTNSSSDDGSNSSPDEGSSSTDNIEITSVANKDSFVLFENNKKEKVNKNTEFYDRDNAYQVGDKGTFNFKPQVSFIKRISPALFLPANPETWNYVVTLYVFETDNFVKLEGADLESYVESIDNENCLIDLKADAIGKKFKLEVYPEGLTAEQTQEIATYTVSIEFEVVDAFNAYNALELAYIQKRVAGYGDETTYLEDSLITAWNNFFEEKGLDKNLMGSSVVLHDDISITPNDIPSEYFYTAEDVSESDGDYEMVVGSLLDYETIYYRYLENNEQFLFEGNYFTLKADQIPCVVRPRAEVVAADVTKTSHSQLFLFQKSATTTGEFVKVQNVNLVGNAPKVENVQKSGGLILNKSAVDCEFYNNISNGWFVNYFPELNHGTYTVNKCKAYDSFSSLIYVWGSSNMVIKDSEIIGGGGPAIIADHVEPNQGASSYPSNVTVINSEIHSYVTGQEGWFVINGGSTIVGQIKAMDLAFNPFGKSFLFKKAGDTENTYIDFITLYKSGSAEGITDELVSGNFSMNGVLNPMDFGTYQQDWDGVGRTTQLSIMLDGASALGAPAFVTSNGGASIFNGQYLSYDGSTQITDPNDLMFSGDYLYLYYSRMGIVFGYDNVGATISE